MLSSDGRRFLQQSRLPARQAPHFFLGRFARAETSSASNPAERVFIDPRQTLAPVDRIFFGSFLGHRGPAIYEGIYDRSSKLSDSNGFRIDVLDVVRQPGIPIIYYPGRQLHLRLQLA
jgi:hypothetical protein